MYGEKDDPWHEDAESDPARDSEERYWSRIGIAKDVRNPHSRD